MTTMHRHFRTFYGRPKAQVTQLLDLVTKARPRTQRRRDRDEEYAQRIIAGLTPDQQTTIERWIAAREEIVGIAGAALVLDWFLGEGLSPALSRRLLKEPWGEEIGEPYAREG